ncbi:helix-turn-helix domain-containing protein [Variovorax sp. J22G73]|uniref:helix-turn-helix domain-containing protein n=1 Tax=unclassified Variovorax TaxID=663243 RepID=UPI0025788757|nr:MULTISPECIES: helix-turn-helix domain-containing protein [unclassified Variovorax]MDM0003198.1 helix-turn-helix domain-containing protein [Variovorax sp. J22R203]MDM0097136.1 helix-turn-helix domain-containing protein [Variovorax sp. J22G73]
MIGERLKELRTARGLSLRDLAAQAGVSATLLSQIERSVTDPSLETMCRLAGVFGESVSSLFMAAAPPSVWISRPGKRSLLTAPKGQVGYERLTAGNGQLEVLRAVLQPGQVSADEPRGHESTECVYVVAGALVAQIAGVDYPVLAGESISFDSRLPHRYLNQSQAATEIILSVTPPNP